MSYFCGHCIDRVEYLLVACRKALRIIWRVQLHTQCDVIAALSGSTPLILNLRYTFVHFSNKGLENDYNVMESVAFIFSINQILKRIVLE